MQISSVIPMLLTLQSVDARLQELTTLLKTIPQEEELAQKRLEEQESILEHLQTKLNFLNKKRVESAQVIAELEASLASSKNLLLQVSNEKEHIAALKQIDSLEKQQRKLEEENLLLHEELSFQEQELVKQEQATTEQKNLIQQYMQENPIRIQEYKKEQSNLLKQREKIATTIPTPMLERYEFIHQRISGNVLTKVVNNICHACRVTLPTQLTMSLPNAQQIFTCPSCQRILYLENSE